MILPLKNNQIELRYLKKLLDIILYHVCILTHKKPTSVTSIAFD